VTEQSIAKAREQFEKNTTEHELIVLQDEGLYRHLRCMAPGTRIWSWDIVTWPGYLAITGDIGDGWVFTREPDMLTFMLPISEPYRINADYWWEKMPEHLRRAAKPFSADRLKQRALESIEDWGIGKKQTEKAKAAFLADFDPYSDEPDLRLLLDEFTFTDKDCWEGSFADTWEWDTSDWDHHFLLALFAIVWATERYAALQPATAAKGA